MYCPLNDQRGNYMDKNVFNADHCEQVVGNKGEIYNGAKLMFQWEPTRLLDRSRAWNSFNRMFRKHFRSWHSEEHLGWVVCPKIGLLLLICLKT